MDKYKNKDGIELSYTQRNNTQTDLVKEVISESIKILGMCDKNCKISMGIAMSNTKKFLNTNFDIEEDKQYKLEDFGEVVAWNKDGTPFIAYRDNKKKDTQQEQSFEDNDNNIDMIGL